MVAMILAEKDMVDGCHDARSFLNNLTTLVVFKMKMYELNWVEVRGSTSVCVYACVRACVCGWVGVWVCVGACVRACVCVTKL